MSNRTKDVNMIQTQRMNVRLVDIVQLKVSLKGLDGTFRLHYNLKNWGI